MGHWPLLDRDVATGIHRRRHRQCAWCLRLKHESGAPHGQPLPRLRYYSHGICAECKSGLLPHQAWPPIASHQPSRIARVLVGETPAVNSTAPQRDDAQRVLLAAG